MNLYRLILLAPAVCLLGCGDSVDPGRGVPVSGTVTMDGKPLEGASVSFLNETFTGYGRTDAQGKYRLVQGALPGKNKVVISKVEGGAAPAAMTDAESGMDAGQFEAAAMGSGEAGIEPPKDLVPAEYSNPASTKLTFEVPGAGADGVDFNI